MSLLKNWAVIYGVENNWREPPTPYHAPEQRTQHLHGEIYSDPRFEEGSLITTSTIKGKKNGCVVTRSGTLYVLGDPALDYEKQFPGAKERLMNSLPEIL